LAALKLCQVLAGAESGGLERHFADLCGGLAERGHRVTAIAHARYADDLPPSVDFVPLDLARSRRNPRALFDLARAIRRVRPDIVHAQASKAAAMVAAVKPWLACPGVATVHNIKRRQRMLRRFERVIAVSGSVARSLQGLKVDVVHNGVDAPASVEASVVETLRNRFSTDGRPLVLAVGRLVEAKGFDLLVDAWRGIDATLLIAGEGPLHDALAGRIAQAGLARRIHLLGHRDDVPALMTAADLVVMPSRHEGLPYVLLEALHLNRPVVAARVAGAADLLPPRWLVPVADERALSAAIQAALSDRERLLDDMAPVWKRAATAFTLDAMVSNTEAVYRRVLNG